MAEDGKQNNFRFEGLTCTQSDTNEKCREHATDIAFNKYRGHVEVAWVVLAVLFLEWVVMV